MKCSVTNCEKLVDSRGWCREHYGRWRRHGDPLGGRTSRGAVRRYMRDVVLPHEADECLFWPYSKDRGGYAQFDKHRSVCRYLCELSHGVPPTREHHAAHSCGKGKQGCVNKRHLSWKTRLENDADKLIHGTVLRGERQNGAKLTEENVRQIRLLKDTMLQREIGAMFGVNYITVNDIFHGRTWAWL